jgi:hypothetical protein
VRSRLVQLRKVLLEQPTQVRRFELDHLDEHQVKKIQATPQFLHHTPGSILDPFLLIFKRTPPMLIN